MSRTNEINIPGVPDGVTARGTRCLSTEGADIQLAATWTNIACWDHAATRCVKSLWRAPWRPSDDSVECV